MTQTIQAEKTTFLSKDPTHRLVRVPARRRYNDRGEQEILPGEVYEFDQGKLEVSDPEVVDWLREHPNFNRKFWEVGNEPGRERPTVDEALTAIAVMAGKGDAVEIAHLYDTERRSYNREVVLNTAQAALEALDQVRAQAEGNGAPEPVAPPQPPAEPDAEPVDPAPASEPGGI